MVTIAELLEGLSGTISPVAFTPASARTPITRVLLPDPGEEPVVVRGDLVVGIGVLAGSSAQRLLSRVAEAGGAALIARERTAAMLAPDAERLGATLMAVPESTPWIHVTQVISSVVSDRNPPVVADGAPAAASHDPGELELLGTVLGGGDLAVVSAGRLDLPGPRFIVVAAAAGAEGDSPGGLTQLRDLMAIHLSSHRRLSTTIANSVVYGVVSVPASTERASSALREGLNRLAERSRSLLRCAVMIGIGHVVPALSEIASSREQADRAVGVLRAEHRTGVADAEEVASRILLLEVADALRGDPSFPTPPVRVLERHDLQNSTNHLQTLAAYLDAFGSVDAAAQQLRVHSNTVRYRLRQIQGLTGLDLSDPDDRLALTLQLRLLAGRGTRRLGAADGEAAAS